MPWRTGTVDLRRRSRQRDGVACRHGKESRGRSVAAALSPEQVLAQFQSGTAVHRALLSLSAQRRHLLGLAFFKGLSHQEIADATRMPLGTVKSHLRRALAALQGELAVDA